MRNFKKRTPIGRRIIATALALIMTGSLLPAGVFTPLVKALTQLGTPASTLTIDADGNWEATFYYGTGSTSTGTWVIGVMPDVSVNGAKKPSESDLMSGVTSETGMNNLIDLANAKVYQVKSGSDTSTTVETAGTLYSYTVSGKLPKGYAGTASDYTLADIPMVAILYTGAEPNGRAFAYTTWKAPVDGKLQNGGIISTANGVLGATTASSTDSSATNYKYMECNDGDVTYVSAVVSLMNSATTPAPVNASVSFTTNDSDGKTVPGDGNKFIAGKTYIVTLTSSGGAWNTQNTPIIGTITVTYKVASGAVKTHVIPVQLGNVAQYMLVDGGEYTIKQGASAWEATPAPVHPKITQAPRNGYQDRGCFPGLDSTGGTTGSIVDTNNYVKITAPFAADPGSGQAFASSISCFNPNDTITVYPGSNINNQNPDTYVTTINYNYWYRNGNSGAWAAKVVAIPITIHVIEGTPSASYKVKYQEPSDSDKWPSHTSDSITGWPDPDQVTVNGTDAEITLPSPDAGDHWTFEGWKVVGGNGTTYTGNKSLNDMGATPNGDGEVTLEAVWTHHNRYKITYDLNFSSVAATGGSGGPITPDEGAYNPSGTTSAPTLPDPTDVGVTAPSGYRFVGWSTISNAVFGVSDLYKAGLTGTNNTYTLGTASTATVIGGTQNDPHKIDLAIKLYATWSTPPKITNATPDGGNYVKGDKITLNSVHLSDGNDVPKIVGSNTNPRWANDVEIVGWAMGSSTYHDDDGVGTTYATGDIYTIPTTAEDGDWVWVKVKGKGIENGELDPADISEEAVWIKLVKIGAAEAILTAQVLYYDGTTYHTTAAAAGLSAAAQINGTNNQYTGSHTAGTNITLTTTYGGTDLEFVGWSTTQVSTASNLYGNCVSPALPTGWVHSANPPHKIIQDSPATSASVHVQMDTGKKSSDSVTDLPIATTVYAIYRVKQKAALTVGYALSSGGSSPTYSVWSAATSNGASVSVVPSSATTGMFGGDTANITASMNTATYDYKFIGWMMDNNGPDGTLITSDSGSLTNVSVNATGATGAATFTMATTPVATTVYAVYEAIPTRTLIVKRDDPGISSVVVKRTRDGVPTIITPSTGSTASNVYTYASVTVRKTDVITVTSTANTSAGYSVNGFTVDDSTCTNTISSNSVTLMLDGDNDTVTVHALAKLDPPNLKLTAAQGNGTETSGTLTNGTSPVVTVKNDGPSAATIKSVALSTGDDGDRFTLSSSTALDSNVTSLSEKDGSGDTGYITIAPDTSLSGWTPGTYTFTLTVTYTNPNYKDADGNLIEYTKSVTVKYVVTESQDYTGKVTVLVDGQPAYQVGGSTGPTAQVKIGTSGTATDVDSSGEHSVSSLSGTQSVTVTYNGKTYTAPSLSKANPEVTVELFTVTINLANTSVEQNALQAASGTTPTFTLTVTGQPTGNNGTVAVTTSNLTSGTASVVVLKGSSVTINGAGGTSTTALNSGYSFDKWSEGKYATDGDLSGSNVTNLPDVSTNPYTFTVEGTTSYTAHLKKENYKVLTFDDNEGNAPNIDTSNSYAASNMPSSQVTTGDSVTIPNVTPVLPGYKFVGWSTSPTRGAANWNVSASTDYAPGNTVSGMTGDMTLYAIWDDARITFTTGVPTITDGVYGSNYSLSVAATTDPSAALAYAVSSGATTATLGLPAGLTLNTSTGAITGQPQTTGKGDGTGYAYAAFTPTFTITLATDYHAAAYKVTTELVADGSGATTGVADTTNPNKMVYHTATGDTLEVEKAQPVITGVSVTGVVPGAALSTATYNVSVTGPRWTGTAWETYTETIVYVSGSKTSSNAGSLTFTNVTPSTSTANNFETGNNDTTLKVEFTPEAQDVSGSASPSGTAFDGYLPASEKNLQSHVWKAAKKEDAKATPSGSVSAELKVRGGDEQEADASYAFAKSWTYQTNETPAKNARKGYSTTTNTGTDGFVTRDGASSGVDTVNAKTFVIKNTSSVPTGNLSYSFGQGTSSPFALEGWTNAGLAGSATKTITVKVNAANAPGVGTYTDTLTITGADGGSVTIFLTFTVDAPATYTAYVKVNVQNVDSAKVEKTQLPSGLGLTTTAGSPTVARVNNNSDPHDGEYAISGLVVGTTYQLKVTNTAGGDYTVPGVSLAYSGTQDSTAEITLYQVTYETHKDDHNGTPTSDTVWTPPTHTSGAGYYVSGQYATMNTRTSYVHTPSGGSATTYEFSISDVKWTKRVTALDYSSSSSPSTEVTGTTVATDQTFVTAITQPTTFYAHYKAVVVEATKVYLKYDANTVSGAINIPADQSYDLASGDVSHQFTISGNIPSDPADNYLFVGWSTESGRSWTDWSTSDNSGEDFDPSDPITVPAPGGSNTGTVTLYAIWMPISVLPPHEGGDAWVVSLTDGVYGEPYACTIGLPYTNDGAGVTLSAQYRKGSTGSFTAGLPGGLTLNQNGTITGKPYEVGDFEVKITATHATNSSLTRKALNKADGSEETEDDTILAMKVKPHPVTLVNTSAVSGVAYGSAITSAVYETTVVTLPLYGGKADGVDTWNTVAYPAFTETLNTSGGGKGTLAITSPSSGNFSESPVTVTLLYTPSGTEKDANNSVHNVIYETGTTSIKVSAAKPEDQHTYTMVVEESRTDWSSGDNKGANITMWGPTVSSAHQGGFKAKVNYTVASADTTTDGSTSSNAINPQLFTLTNTGNQATGALSYVFTSTSTETSAYFEVNFKDTTHTTLTLDKAAGLAVSGNGTFLVRPKVVTPNALTPGTYTDTLVITNANGFSVSIALTLIVEKDTVAVTLYTYLWAVGDTVKAMGTDYSNVNAPTLSTATDSGDVTIIEGKRAQVTGGTVKLVDVSGTSSDVSATWNGTSSAYTASIDYDTTYRVVINGYTVPGVTISRDLKTGHVYLYQVTTAHTPSAGATNDPTAVSSATTGGATGSGSTGIYVVHGEAATVTADTASTGYNYTGLYDTTSGTVASGGVLKTTATSYTAVVNAPMAFTAAYTQGYKLTYRPNASDVTASNSSLTTTTATVPTTGVEEAVNLNDVVTVKAPSVLTVTTSDGTYTNWTRANYVFVGWSTEASRTAATWSTTTNPTTDFAPGDSITIDGNKVLYAIWAPKNDHLTFAGDSYTVAHYDTLDEQFAAASGAVGTVTYTRDSVTLPGTTITFDDTNRKFTSSSAPVMYDTTGALNTATTKVTANDAGNGSSVSADFTITVTKAKTEVTTPWDGVDPSVKAGDTFDFTKLTVDDEPNSSGDVEVEAKKTDGTPNTGVDFQEAPAADGTATDNSGNLGGKWTVKDENGDTVDKFLPGKHKYTFTFTPDDEGFESSSFDLELEFEKLIQEVTVSLTFPVDSQQPSTTAIIENPTGTSNVPVVSTANSPTAVYTDASVDGTVLWSYVPKVISGNSTFDRKHPVTAIVKVTPNTTDDWKFVATKTNGTDYDFKGYYSNLTTPTKADKDTPAVTILNVDPDGSSATLLYTWPGEDTAATNIQIKVTVPTDGGTPDKEATPLGTPLGSFVTTGTGGQNITEWYEKSLSQVNSTNYTSLGAEATSFAANKTYVAIVTATVNEGYYFNSDNAGLSAAQMLAALDNTSGYATINGMNAKVLKIEYDTSDNKRATKVVLAVEFTVKASDVVRLTSEGSVLAYYAMTDTKAKNDMTGVTLDNDKHHDNTATGHKSGYGFTLKLNGSSGTIKISGIDKQGAQTSTSNVVLFVDVDGGTAGQYDEGTDLLLSKKTTSGTDNKTVTYTTPDFTFISNATSDDVAKFDGKTLYAAYVTDNGTEDAAVATTSNLVIAVGTLRVKKLEAKSIAPAPGGWTVDGNNKFQVTTTVNTTVEFNTGDPMTNSVTSVSYAERAGSLATNVKAPADAPSGTTHDHRPSYYYMLDVNDNFSASAPDFDSSDIELKSNTDVSSYVGKNVYICYTDVNGNLVATKVGTLGSFGVKVEDKDTEAPRDKEHDAEYGDNLTAIPTDSDGTPSDRDPNRDFDYQWKRWKPKNSDEGNQNPNTPGAEGEWEDIDDATGKDYTPGKDDVGGYVQVEVTDRKNPDNPPEYSDGIYVDKRSLKFDVLPYNKNYDGDAKNEHLYTKDDFILVGTATGRVGVLPADLGKVFLEPAGTWNGNAATDEDNRPPYGAAAVGSVITWPAVSAAGTASVNASKLSDYRLTGKLVSTTADDADKYYQMVPQDQLTPRGEILANGVVTHVDVSFKEKPATTVTIPGAPMGVTKLNETWPTNWSSTPDPTNATSFGNDTVWYKLNTGVTALDPSNPTAYGSVVNSGNFVAGERYVVMVSVKPANGYKYKDGQTLKTSFFFHFGQDQAVEVTQWTPGNSGAANPQENGVYIHSESSTEVYTMFYTFTIPDDLAVLAPGGGDASDSALSGTFYLTTTKHTASNATAANVPVGNNASGKFALVATALNGMTIQLSNTSGTIVVADAATTNNGIGYHYTASNTTGWQLVVGDSPASVTELGESWDNTTWSYTFNKTVSADASKWDGKKVYLKSGDTVIPTVLGTLTVKELEVTSVAPTYQASKSATDIPGILSYAPGTRFDASSVIAGAQAKFLETTALTQTYTTTTQATSAAMGADKYYFQIADVNGSTYTTIYSDATSGTELSTAAHDGKLLYLCYTDIHGIDNTPACSVSAHTHTERYLLGALSVKSGGVAEVGQITIDYTTPENSNKPANQKRYTDTNAVSLVPHDTNDPSKADSNQWYALGTSLDNSDDNNFTTASRTAMKFAGDATGSDPAPGDSYAYSNYYMVVTTFSPKSNSYELSEETEIVVDGVLEVKADGTVAVNGSASSGLIKAKATYDSASGKITLMVIYKVAPAPGVPQPDPVTNVYVVYEKPVTEAKAAAELDWGDRDQVTLSGATKWWELTGDYNASSSWSGGTGMTNGTSEFEAGTWYRAESTITAKTGDPGYAFNGDSQQIRINGVVATVGGAVVAAGDGYVKAEWADSGKTQIKAMYIAKTIPVDKVIVKVITSVTAPAAGVNLQNPDIFLAANVKNVNLQPEGALSYASVTWNNSGSVGSPAALGTAYTVEYDVKTNTGYSYRTTGNYDVEFTINGHTLNVKNDATDYEEVVYDGTASGDIKVTLTRNTSSADTYHVKIEFAATQDKTKLTDVVVEASPAALDVKMTGPSVTDKPYEIDTTANSTSNKWFYWDTTSSAWKAATNGDGLSSDGKFLAGYDYRVEAQVKLKSTSTNYQITNATKFYIAGYEVTTSTEVELHPKTSGEKALQVTSSAGADGVYAANTVFTLIKTFHIPAEAEAPSGAYIYIEEQATGSQTKAEYGDTLVAHVENADNPGDLGYKWQRLKENGDPSREEDWEDISGETGSTYTTKKADVGRKVRAVLTKDGSSEVKNPNSNAIEVGKKTLKVTFQAKDKTWDGTTDAELVESSVTVTGAVAGDSITVAENTATKGEFADSDVGTWDVTLLNDDDDEFDEDDLVFTSSTTDAAPAGKGLTDYYNVVIESAEADITAITLTWNDFTFTGKVKRYDGTKTVYKQDNFSLTDDNTANPSGNAAYGTAVLYNEGLWTISDAGVLALVGSKLKATNVEYTSANSLEPRGQVLTSGTKANGHSVITLTMELVDPDDTSVILPANNKYYIKESGINPKQIKVGVKDLAKPTISADATAITLNGTVKKPDRDSLDRLVVDGDSPFAFWVVGDVAQPVTGSSANVTIVGVTANSSAGIGWTDNNFLPVWDDGGNQHTVPVIEGVPNKVKMAEGATIVYGEEYSTAEGVSITVSFTSGDPVTVDNFADLANLGVTTIVAHDTDSDGVADDYEVITNSTKAGWDSNSNNTAIVSVKFYLDSALSGSPDLGTVFTTDGTYNPLNDGDNNKVTVTQRPLDATSKWSLDDGSKIGKYYDGTTAVLSGIKDATAAVTAADTTATITLTYTSRAFNDGDTEVVLKGYTAAFYDKDAADAKQPIRVITTSATLDGTLKNRYKVGTVADAEGNIKPRPVTITMTKPSVPQYANVNTALKESFDSSKNSGIMSGDTINVGVAVKYKANSGSDPFDGTNIVGVFTGNIEQVGDPIYSGDYSNYVITLEVPGGDVTPIGKITRVSITYPDPAAGEEPVPTGKDKWTYVDLYKSTEVEVDETDNTTTTGNTKDTKGTTWYVTKLADAPTSNDDFKPEGTTGSNAMTLLSGDFDYDTYYMVEGVIKPKSGDGYSFDKTGTVTVTINGIIVTVGGTFKANNDGTGWAMAIWDGDNIKVRYIAKTESAETTVIDRVKASVVAPSNGVAPNTSVTVEAGTYLENGKDATKNVKTYTVTWSEADAYDATGNGYATMSPGSKFKNGKYYKAEFKVTPDTGYTFQNETDANDYVGFIINEVRKNGGYINDTRASGLTDEATDSTSGIKVITTQTAGNDQEYTITVLFPMTGEKNSSLTVEGNADVPTRGASIAAANIWVDSDKPYEIKGGTEKKWQHWNGTTWEDVTSGNFIAGDYYRAVMTVELKSGANSDGVEWKNLYEFTTTTPGSVNGAPANSALTDAQPTLSGLKTSIRRNNTDGNAETIETITLAKEFRVAKEQVTVKVDSPVPTAGAHVYEIDPDVNIYIHAGDENYYELSDGTAQGSWYKYEGGVYTKMGENDVFEAGKTYYLLTTATAKSDYFFSNAESGYKWYETGTGRTMAYEASVLKVNGIWVEQPDGEVTQARVAFAYTIQNNREALDGVIYVEPPVKGQSPKDAVSPNDSVNIEDTKWTDKNGNELKDDDKFQAGGHYTAHVTIDPEKPDGTGEWKEGDTVKVNGQDKEILKDDTTGELYVELEWDVPADPPSSGGGGGGSTVTVENPVVYYHLKDQGVTDDPTAEKVKKNNYPKNVPHVKPVEGLKFLGWSEVDPSTLPAGTLPTLVDPTTFKITADKWFYAVYEQGVEIDHYHYVIGFPNGTFGPDAKITRAEVATIIARSCLEGFVEGANYGNPGNYSDVSHHWAFSAIAFCARAGVFTGYEDGTFRPDRYITRQELATVVARLAGVQTSKGLPFNDRNQIASWAMNGVYTAYANGWVKGYEDNTFQPERDISRAETVKIFNGYLGRGVDRKGLEGLKEYVHSGVASNNTENGHDEYMTWPDVAKTHWAYYEIIEAANDHNYHWQDAEKETPPEAWEEVYIEEKWRYNDNMNDGAERRDENMNAPTTFTVTYLVSSNGVTYDAITETVERFASPDPAKLPEAVPNEGYRFAGWSTTDPSTGTVNLVDPTASGVTADVWFYAVFKPL